MNKVKTYSDFQEAIVQNNLDEALNYIKAMRVNSEKVALSIAIEMIETIAYRNRPPESDGTEEQTTCQYEEIIEDWPYCNHKATRYYDCKNCEV